MGEQEWFSQDFYKMLGVKKDADETAIKKAYRKLARKYHPDQNQGDAKAEERFKEISEAYSVLSDPEQRERYDAIQQMAAGGARFAPGPGGAGGASGFEDLFGGMFGGAHGGNPNVQFQSGGAGYDDILSSLFGGGGGGSFNFGGGGGAPQSGYTQSGFGGYAPPPTQGADLSAETSISFREAFEGTQLKVTIDGRPVTMNIPAGVRDGQKIRLRGKGRPGSNGGPAGDLKVTVKVESDPVFSIDGHKLRIKLPISYQEAVLGAQVSVPLPDGTSVKVKVPAGSSSGRTLRVSRRGIHKGSKRGDAYVDLTIVVPTNMSGEEKELVKKLQELQSGWDPRAAIPGGTADNS